MSLCKIMWLKAPRNLRKLTQTSKGSIVGPFSSILLKHFWHFIPHAVFNKSSAISLQTSKHSQILSLQDNRGKYYSEADLTAPESQGKGFTQSVPQLWQESRYFLPTKQPPKAHFFHLYTGLTLQRLTATGSEHQLCFSWHSLEVFLVLTCNSVLEHIVQF